VPKEAGR